ncbi:MAG: CDP-alcohol phosphatidyltransferase family protein [Desulfobacterales bacterium]|nr:CDP-alcohol phosphatidyltransferase family protein [Desulfobacterales bacterium]
MDSVRGSERRVAFRGAGRALLEPAQHDHGAADRRRPGAPVPAPGRDPPRSQAVAWAFIVAAVSDLVDGWLARRGQQVTSIGKLLDPLADKLLVSTALIVLVSIGRIPVWATWMVVVIIGRELAVTGLRGIASAGGRVMAPPGSGSEDPDPERRDQGAALSRPDARVARPSDRADTSRPRHGTHALVGLRLLRGLLRQGLRAESQRRVLRHDASAGAGRSDRPLRSADRRRGPRLRRAAPRRGVREGRLSHHRLRASTARRSASWTPVGRTSRTSRRVT